MHATHNPRSVGRVPWHQRLRLPSALPVPCGGQLAGAGHHASDGPSRCRRTAGQPRDGVLWGGGIWQGPRSAQQGVPHPSPLFTIRGSPHPSPPKLPFMPHTQRLPGRYIRFPTAQAMCAHAFTRAQCTAVSASRLPWAGSHACVLTLARANTHARTHALHLLHPPRAHQGGVCHDVSPNAISRFLRLTTHTPHDATASHPLSPGAGILREGW